MTPPFSLWTGSTEVALSAKQWTGASEVALSAEAYSGATTPTVVVGVANSGTTGAVTYTNPTHQANDLLLLLTESQQTAGLTAPTGGWANVTNSPRAQGTNALTINGFWKRCASSAEANPVVPAATNHQIGVVLRIRGAVTTGDPWDFSLAGGASAVSTVNFDSGGVTVGPKRLIITALTNSTDTATNQFSSAAGPGQTGFATVFQQFTTNGGGGGLLVATGEKTNAGTVAPVTATIATSSIWAGLMLAIKPAA